MKSIFLSYSFSENQTAEYLRKILKNLGYDIWTTSSISSQNDFQQEIFSKIRKSSTVIALLDNASHNVIFDVGFALGASKQIFLVGSKIEEIPCNLAALPFFELRQYDKKSINKIIEAIEHHTPGEDSFDLNQHFDIDLDLKQKLSDQNYIESLSSKEFEQLVEKFFIKLGFESLSKDACLNNKKFDILIKDPCSDFSSIIEVKKNSISSTTGLNAVLNLINYMDFSNVKFAILVSSSKFSGAVYNLAEKYSNRIKLFTLHDLIDATKSTIMSF